MTPRTLTRERRTEQAIALDWLLFGGLLAVISAALI